ncbi:MAG: WecB/TagA/CpsF family glycosyltransferase [Acidimicrobiales bacterium]
MALAHPFEHVPPVGEFGPDFADLDRVELFGLPFVSMRDEASFADEVMDWKPASDVPSLVITPNVDILVQRARGFEPVVAETFARAVAYLPDGFPIVAVSKLAGRPLPARLAGSTLFAEIWPRWAATGRSVTVVAANDDIVDRLADEHRGANFYVPPKVDEAPSLDPIVGAIIDRVDDNGSEVVVVGLGFPNDLRLIAALIEAWPAGRPAPLLLCLGASAELYLGLRRRAPDWMQRVGLEWFHRFCQEPRRMFRRYFVRDLAFLPLAYREIRRSP